MPQEKSSVRIGFLASHNGTSFRVLLEKKARGPIHVVPVVLISNNKDARCLEVADKFGIPSFVINKARVGEDNLDQAICECLQRYNADFVVTAGYMKKLGPRTLRAFPNRILNSHPALLPKFGGKGMYGRYVHEAVLAAKEKESGVTIHLVDEEYDTGPIITQISTPILENETVESLENRIKTLESDAYLQAIMKLVGSPSTASSTDRILMK